MGVLGLNHVGISAADLTSVCAFYCTYLGMSQSASFSWASGNTAADAGLGLTDSAADVVVINAGNVFLEAFQFRSPRPERSTGPGFGPLTWAVTDAALVRDAAVATGGRVLPDGSVLDPAGIRLLLRETDAAPPADGGSEVVIELTDVALRAVTPDPVADWWAQVAPVTVHQHGGPAEPPHICDLGANHVCLDVTDIDTVHAALSDKGMTCHTPPVTMPGGHAIVGYGWDPWGNALELMECLDSEATLHQERLRRRTTHLSTETIT
jgi:catechol 2,3-dioxygenase-like lactoylglutathione lyase family enzyme